MENKTTKKEKNSVIVSLNLDIQKGGISITTFGKALDLILEERKKIGNELLSVSNKKLENLRKAISDCVWEGK